MRRTFYIYLIVSVLLLLCFSFVDIKLITLFIILIISTVYFCTHRQDYIQNETTNAKTHSCNVDGSAESDLFLKSATVDDLYHSRCKHLSDERLVNSFFNTPFIMWNKQSLSVSNSKGSPISKPMAKMKLKSTMPVLSTSPMSTRLRTSRKTNLNGSVTSAAGPLLSSPFIPQIKRALGLEPNSQTKYSLSRRHSLHVPPSITTDIPAGTLPHVRLSRSRKTSLSDRNTSMLNRSSTVKIAPPTPGKVASPSLYQMRADVSIIEDRSTPDTYAVVNALKERRKRSINSHDETPELPLHQAKRRRQESQQSNASTSSLPGPPMPDNLPDLSNASFALRMETSSLKRPSRPSQDSPGEWDREREGPAKRLRGEMRNNSILSSLSSSRRFAEKQVETQSMKRKADKSFHDKENETSQNKMQKTETVILPRENTLAHLIKRKPELPLNKDDTVLLTNGHTDMDNETQVNSQTPTKQQTSRPALLKNMTSMKKSATIYSGLATKGSFTKAQFANVVATAADYDSDRETDQKRVQQMLQDLDDSFSKQEAKSSGLLTTDSVPKEVTSAINTSIPSITTATSAVSIATTVVSIATSTQPSVLSSLTSLSQLSKSPVQESVATQETSSVPKSEESSATTTTTTTSSTASPQFKPLFGPATTAAIPSAPSDSKPDGFSFGLKTSAPSSVINPVMGQSSTSSAISQSTSLGPPPAYPFGSSISITSANVAATTPLNLTATPSTGVSGLSSQGNFSFGSSQTKTETVKQPSVSVSVTPTVTPSAPVGFGFPTSTQAPNASTGGLGFTATGGLTSVGSNLSFGVSSNTASSAAATGGFSFGQTPSSSSSAAPMGGAGFGQTPSTTSAAPMGGFSFGQTPSAIATSAPSAGLSFGQVTAASQPSSGGLIFVQAPGAASGAGGLTFGQTPAITSASGFSFGQGAVPPTASSAGFAVTPSVGNFAFGQAASTAASVKGFSFGQSATTTTASTGGFNFGTGLSTTKPSASAGLFPSASTTSAPAASGFGFGGAGSTSTPAFGNPAATQPSAGLAFGSSGGASTAAFGFGANQAATTTAPSQTFQFGANTATSSGLTFGATSTSAQPAPFGTAATSAPAFGAPSGSSQFSFGAGSSGMAATATPFQTNTPATSAGGFSFGQGTGSAFAFGGASTSAPAFGASSTSIPAFGSNPQSGSVFGGANVQTAQSSVLGGGVKSNTPVFGGGSHSQSNTPVFGGSSNPAPAFGPKSLTPTFGSSTNNNAGFNFGQQPAPNVNPFGQTTPAKQTGSAFGQTGLESTPQQQTGPVFQFGQSGTQQASTVVKGFDFSASAGGASGGGFNFAAGGTPGGFGTPTGTPNGTPTPGFNVGLGAAPRLPRVVSKARRRTARK